MPDESDEEMWLLREQVISEVGDVVSVQIGENRREDFFRKYSLRVEERRDNHH